MAMRRLVALLLAAVFVLLGVAAWVVGSMESAPSNQAVAPANLPAADIRLTSTDGLALAGTYWASPEQGAPGVVLLHGNGSSRQSMVKGAQWLNGQGYAVLTIDLRGHGQSAPARKSFGYLEARDAAAAVTWLRKEQGDAKIAVIGSSLGGAAALIGEHGPVAADGLVLQAVYPDIRSAVRNRVATRLGTVFANCLEPLLSFQSRVRLGVWPDRLSPIAAIRRFRGPVLIIGGSSDRYTPLPETRELFDAAPGPKELWIAEGRSHNDLVVASDGEWTARVGAFLSAQFPIKSKAAEK